MSSRALPITAERFNRHVQRQPSGCLLWTGAVNNQGYGQVGDDHQVRLAHRVAYQLFVGPIPTGLTIDHLCRVITCVEPTHLEPVTREENYRRARVARWGSAFKAACPQGHPYSGDNLQVKPDGRRQCRTCTNARRRVNPAVADGRRAGAAKREAARTVAHAAGQRCSRATCGVCRDRGLLTVAVSA